MELHIARGGLLKLDDAVGTVVEVRKGALWLTEEGNPRDYYLTTGDWLRLEGNGLAIAHALQGSFVTLHQAVKPADQPLWARLRRLVLQPHVEMA